MKQFLGFISITCILCVCLSSCQREFDIEDDPGTEPPVSTSSVFLDKLYYIDSIAGVKDTFRIVSYIYDAQKRVVKIIDSSDVGPAGALATEKTFEYNYNGSDSIPYKSLYQKYSWSSPTPAIDSQTTFHYYDASLNRIKDSISDYSSNGTGDWFVQQYVHNSNSIYTRQELSPGVFDTVAISWLDARGNITLGELEPDGTFQYQFDANPSPFARLSNFRALEMSVSIESTTDFYLIKNSNNITKNMDLMPSESYSNTWDLTGDYSYRTDGYPDRIRDEYDTNEFEIIAFRYKTL
ncbi:MAG: hypothetical protein QM687_16030 [Ferruginibacter sp.]